MAIRRQAHINQSSDVKIVLAEADCYMAAIDDKVMVKLGPRYGLHSC